MNFYHSGEVGDIIYGLKAIKRVGGHLYVDKELRIIHDPTRDKIALPNKSIDDRQFSFLEPLVKNQSYIKSFQLGTPDNIDYNLNDFRKTIFEHQGINFADLFVKSCNFEVDLTDSYTPWIECKSKFVSPISVIRVNRRINDNFPWKVIADNYHSQMVFLGTKKEHENFVNFVDYDIEHYDSSNLLDICEVINGSSLFIGNCTSLSVCAEALKKNMIFENEHCSYEDRYYLHDFNRSNRHNVDPNDFNVRRTMEKIEQFINSR